MYSPFIYNRSVTGKKFYDREEIIENILYYTFRSANLGNIWLLGERQVGKSSILREIAQRFEFINFTTIEGKHVKFVYLNCQTVTNLDVNKFYNLLGSRINEFLELKIRKFENDYEYLMQIGRFINEKNCYLVLLLDEFDALISKLLEEGSGKLATFLANFRTFINGEEYVNSSDKFISVVAASNERYEELTAGLEKHYGSPLNWKVEEIEWFNETQVKGLANKYLNELDVNYLERDISFCYKLTKGYPVLVQKVLDSIFRYHEIQKDVDHKKIETEFNQFLKDTYYLWLKLRIPRRSVERFKKHFKERLKKIDLSIEIGLINV